MKIGSSLPKSVSKQDLELAIKKADILEATALLVERSLSKSSKKNLINKFNREIDSFVEDKRQIILVAIKTP